MTNDQIPVTTQVSLVIELGNSFFELLDLRPTCGPLKSVLLLRASDQAASHFSPSRFRPKSAARRFSMSGRWPAP